MFKFARNLSKTFTTCFTGVATRHLYAQQAQKIFTRSFFNGFGGYAGNMGCRGNPVDRKYYDLLEVQPDASTDDIKKAFRKQAMKHHPDKGGNIEKFKEIKEAYDVLSNEETRQIYDQLGPDGLQQSGSGPGFQDVSNLYDIFESIFGDAGEGFGGRPTRTEDMVQRLPLTLEELYTGVRKDFAVNRNKICTECKGMGTTKKDAVRRCPRCNGKGFVMQNTVVMGMMGMTRSVCPECGGEGSSINPKDKCKSCRGKKVRREREEMSVTIKPGMDHGQKIVLRGASDQDPHMEAGDIVFYIDQIPHSQFRRRGSDLFIRSHIPLLQSLTGTEVVIDHLNGERVHLVSEVGDILPPGCVRCVDDLGMPLYNQEGKFGKLYVQFDVDYPKGLTKKQIEQLKQVLSEPVEEEKEEKEEEVKKEEVKKEEKEEVKKEEKKDEKKEEVKKEEKEEVKKDEKKDEKKEEVKKEEKTEVKKEEVKTEEKKEEKKEEAKTEEAKTEERPDVDYILKDCDQRIYGNRKFWDALFQ